MVLFDKSNEDKNVEGCIGVFGDDGNRGNAQHGISFLSPVTKVSKERQAKKVEQEV